MKRIAAFFLIIAFGCTTSPVNQEKHSEYLDEAILLGEINWDGLTVAPYADWFTPNYLNYVPDSATLAVVKDKLADVTITVFMGTWCEDSQGQVPQFYKMLDYMGYDLGKMKVYGVDRSADGLIVPEEYASYKIAHVPTFIFYRDGKEIGRIVEYPETTIEKDMAAILAN